LLFSGAVSCYPFQSFPGWQQPEKGFPLLSGLGFWGIKKFSQHQKLIIVLYQQSISQPLKKL